MKIKKTGLILGFVLGMTGMTVVFVGRANAQALTGNGTTIAQSGYEYRGFAEKSVHSFYGRLLVSEFKFFRFFSIDFDLFNFGYMSHSPWRYMSEEGPIPSMGRKNWYLGWLGATIRFYPWIGGRKGSPSYFAFQRKYSIALLMRGYPLMISFLECGNLGAGDKQREDHYRFLTNRADAGLELVATPFKYGGLAFEIGYSWMHLHSDTWTWNGTQEWIDQEYNGQFYIRAAITVGQFRVNRQDTFKKMFSRVKDDLNGLYSLKQQYGDYPAERSVIQDQIVRLEISEVNIRLLEIGTDLEQLRELHNQYHSVSAKDILLHRITVIEQEQEAQRRFAELNRTPHIAELKEFIEAYTNTQSAYMGSILLSEGLCDKLLHGTDQNAAFQIYSQYVSFADKESLRKCVRHNLLPNVERLDHLGLVLGLTSLGPEFEQRAKQLIAEQNRLPTESVLEFGPYIETHAAVAIHDLGYVFADGRGKFVSPVFVGIREYGDQVAMVATEYEVKQERIISGCAIPCPQSGMLSDIVNAPQKYRRDCNAISLPAHQIKDGGEAGTSVRVLHTMDETCFVIFDHKTVIEEVKVPKWEHYLITDFSNAYDPLSTPGDTEQ